MDEQNLHLVSIREICRSKLRPLGHGVEPESKPLKMTYLVAALRPRQENVF
jgi:hypothetical protein